MSQRPPRNFRRRQADSGSSSDPDLGPEPSPDSGLSGRASERASGASGSRGRARVWATSRRAGLYGGYGVGRDVGRGLMALYPGLRGGTEPRLEQIQLPPQFPSLTREGAAVPVGRPGGRGGGEDPRETLPAPNPEAQDFSGSSGDSAAVALKAQSSCGEDPPNLGFTTARRAGNLSDPAQAPVARRRWRQGAQAQADFLPLSGKPQDCVFALKGSSDSDSEDEPAPRGTGGSGSPRLRLQVTGEATSSSEGLGGGSSEEEAQDVWEAQQMRKALRVTEVGPASSLCHVQKCHPGKRMSDWPVSFPPVNLDVIKKQLSSRLASLEGVHRSHQREYERCLQDVDSAKSAIAALEKAPDPAPTYAFYKGLKNYLAVLVDCLSEKIVAIQELESAMRSLLQKRAAFCLKRRQEELQSEATYLQQLAARRTDDAQGPGDTDTAVEAPRLSEEAAARRLQRRQAQETCGRCSQPQEGLSSDDDDHDGDVAPAPWERAHLRDRRGDILQRSHKVFEDVSEDFCDAQKILLRFQQWRERFPDSYYEAYASLCLPKLLSPFIRIQMLDWNPLEPGCVPVQRMAWFQALQGFASSGAAARREEEGPDGAILLAALDKTVLPHVAGFVRCLWDPLSTSQTRSLVERCREVLGLRAAVGGGRGHATQDLMDSVISRLKKAVEEDVFIPLYPKRVTEDEALPHAGFQEQRFWSAVKLWDNILLWDGLVPEEALRELALDKLLNRYLVVALSHTGPAPGVLEKYRRVVESLPESWLGGPHAGSCIPQLTSLAQVLARDTQQLHNEEDDRLGSEVREMVLLLVKMKALPQARAFVERNQLAVLRALVGAAP
ncbi:intron Large complex component GCFC2 [Gracilinanus agilis]|uniref:intron Large complex component GCFC2 n=1 Tax=Gracilinanus agilis TaxID=191870 RepID=UPI001CFE28B6|nr:intron Large complex component GCFC2 [Gracilinanus agilis]